MDSAFSGQPSAITFGRIQDSPLRLNAISVRPLVEFAVSIVEGLEITDDASERMT
jgi:hypothetical protein